VAAIGYHFGGKRGLYRTIFETVLDEDESLFVERIGTVERLLARAQGDRAMLSAAVEILVAGLVGRIFAYEHAHWFGVLLARELALPDELFELIYRRRAEPLLGAMTRVTAAATGVGADDPAARLAANLLHGQVGNLVFARPLLWRQLGWEGSTPGQAELLTRTIVDLICRSLGLPTPPRPGQGDPT
jgi:AcrR family transcriptional regulator